MNLDEYLDNNRPSLLQWSISHQDDLLQAKAAVLRGEPKVLVFNWLVDHRNYPGGITTFKTLARSWEKEASLAA